MSKLIPLTQGQHAIVDDEDFASLSKQKWTLLKGRAAHWFRCKETGKPKMILMHRAILAAKDGEQIDHVNRNPLDNRRANLRLCNTSQNNANRRKQQRKTYTPFKGVFRAGKKWRASITISTCHATQEQAARAYDRAALKYFGDFAQTNFPREEYENTS